MSLAVFVASAARHRDDLYLGSSVERVSRPRSIISSTSVVIFISAINPRQVIKLNDPRSLDHPASKCLFIPTPFERCAIFHRRERCVNSESRPFEFLQLSPLPPSMTIDVETRNCRSYVLAPEKFSRRRRARRKTRSAKAVSRCSWLEIVEGCTRIARRRGALPGPIELSRVPTRRKKSTGGRGWHRGACRGTNLARVIA